MNGIFLHNTHFGYLNDKLSRAHTRGLKAKLAQAIGVQPAFLSQVLKQKFSLSLEQADLANRFFDHDVDESEYFLLLVSHDRAGTKSLRKHYEKKIETMLKEQPLKHALFGKKNEVSDEARAIYYSSWVYAAVHAICTVKGMHTRKNMAAKLGLTLEQIEKTLAFLTENRLILKDGENYKAAHNWVRLDRSSPHIIKHHTNWRMRAIQNLEHQDKDDLHYSAIFTADLKVSQKIKNNFLDFIKSQISEIEKAPEDDAYVLCVDWFRPYKGDPEG